ncbi:DUF6368 family protein [Streptomyces sp. M41]|uniref:DUF6368 family protein n=1 Tax=Streptomyces sp. M41 TaxID=3059412 RepID=UPI00374CA1BD
MTGPAVGLWLFGERRTTEEVRSGVVPWLAKVVEISYDTGGGGRWVRHVGDAVFLQVWLRHPQFGWPSNPRSSRLTRANAPSVVTGGAFGAAG